MGAKFFMFYPVSKVFSDKSVLIFLLLLDSFFNDDIFLFIFHINSWVVKLFCSIIRVPGRVAVECLYYCYVVTIINHMHISLCVDHSIQWGTLPYMC